MICICRTMFWDEKVKNSLGFDETDVVMLKN